MDSKIDNPAKLTADNPENQQADQPTARAEVSNPEDAASVQASSSSCQPPLPHERRLSGSGRLAVNKKTEAKKAKAESKYYVRRERIEMTFAGSLNHPKAVKKQGKLDEKHKKKLEKLDKKHNKELARKKDKVERGDTYAS